MFRSREERGGAERRDHVDAGGRYWCSLRLKRKRKEGVLLNTLLEVEIILILFLINAPKEAFTNFGHELMS